MRQQCETEILDFLLLLHVKSVSPRAQNKSKLLIEICDTKRENNIDNSRGYSSPVSEQKFDKNTSRTH